MSEVEQLDRMAEIRQRLHDSGWDAYVKQFPTAEGYALAVDRFFTFAAEDIAYLLQQVQEGIPRSTLEALLLRWRVQACGSEVRVREYYVMMKCADDLAAILAAAPEQESV